MRKYLRSALTGVVAAGSVVALAACGSSSTTPSPGASGTGTGAAPAGAVKSGGTITIDSGTAPLSADQGLDFTTQGNELYSVVNTPLLTSSAACREPAAAQIAARAGQGPADGLQRRQDATPSMLRPGLKYSNGQPIKASDETYALERDIKIPWQAASFISAFIVGGTPTPSGKAKTISGITTNDATGKITVNLVAPFAPIVDIFALAGHGAGAAEHADEEPGEHGHDRRRPVQVGLDHRRTRPTPWSRTRTSTSPAFRRARATRSSSRSTPTCWRTPSRC